jgi:CRISPR/Cas system-associated endonuclease Cas3-HD
MMDRAMIDQVAVLVEEASVVLAVVVVHHAAIHLAQVRGRRQMKGLAHGLLLCD